ncbi:MAG: SOS response-associated peptidase [Methanomicrobiales archaeon]
MCGRFSIAVRIGYLAERFGVSEPVGLQLPRFNIAPGEKVPVITWNGIAQCNMMRWGLIPSWTKGGKPAVTPINARAEGLIEKKIFRSLLSQGRCVIPATGFYEWKKSGDQKYPWYFRMKDHEIFGIAGLFDSWKAPGEQIVRSFSIITTIPNSLVVPYHDRMPAILKQEEERKWLDPGIHINDELATLLTPYSPEDMETYRVTKMVNSPSFKLELTVMEELPGHDRDLITWSSRQAHLPK